MANRTYRVQKDDNPLKVAKALGVTPQKLLQTNGINSLTPGQTLKVPKERIGGGGYDPSQPNALNPLFNPNDMTGQMAVSGSDAPLMGQNYAYNPFPKGVIGSGINAYAGQGEEQASGGAQKVNPSLINNPFNGSGAGGGMGFNQTLGNVANNVSNPFMEQLRPLTDPVSSIRSNPNPFAQSLGAGSSFQLPAQPARTSARVSGRATAGAPYSPPGYPTINGSQSSGSTQPSVTLPPNYVYTGGNDPYAIEQRRIWNLQAGATPEQAYALAVNPPKLMTKEQVWQMKADQRRREGGNYAEIVNAGTIDPGTISGNATNMSLQWRTG